MNKIYCIVILSLASITSYPQNVFQKMIASAGIDLISAQSDMLPLPDSSAIILCSQKDITGSDTDRIFIVKISPEGNIVWNKKINTDSTLSLRHIDFTTNGYILTGCTWSPTIHQSLVVIKIDFNGDIVWTRIYNEAGCGSEIKQMPNGDFVIIGNHGIMPPPPQKHMIMRTDSSGNIIYYNKYPTNWSGSITGLTTRDGGILLYDPQLALIKVDGSGNMLWASAQYDSIIVPTRSGVVESIDSGYVALAYIPNQLNSKIRLIKFNSIGDTLWTTEIGNSLSVNGSEIKALSDGGFIVSGSIFIDNIYCRPYLLKTDSIGNVLWSRTYITNENFLESGAELAVTPDNGFMIQGVSYDTIQNKLFISLIKTDSTGNSSCTNYDAYMVNAPCSLFNGTIFSPQTIPLTTTQGNVTIYEQNSFLFISDSCALTSSLPQLFPENQESISIYPNPSSGLVTIASDFENGNSSIEIFNLPGEIVFTNTFMGTQKEINVKLPQGIYFVKVVASEKQFVMKFIVQ